jgi:predicted RNase H-like HicB family nuclease
VKTVQYYLSLPYPIRIEQVPEEDGGGFVACIPLLGEHMFTGCGDTITEALQSLADITVDHLEVLISARADIPEPSPGVDLPQNGTWLHVPIISILDRLEYHEYA